MKLATIGNTDDVVRIGMGEETDLTIKATAKAFRVLSSGLYRDKINAILREISANAYDAHVEAGKADQPFRVHLPNGFEPYLSIRDYGKGMSDDDIRYQATVYFNSDKIHSNDYIGSHGLGFKSPLSYVKSFTVVCFQNGSKRTYDIFLNEKLIPAISLRSVQETDEPDGVEVIVPATTQEDYAVFANRAKTVFAHYPVRPIITGAPVEFVDPPIIFENKDLGYRILNQMGTPMAIMGIIAYPIDLNALSLDHCHFIGAAEIDFNIGDLDVVAGREDLSYDEMTIKTLKRRLSAISNDIIASAKKMISECATEFEARKLYGQLSNHILGFTAEFHGKEIKSSNFAIRMADFPKLNLRNYNGGSCHAFDDHRNPATTISPYDKIFIADSTFHTRMVAHSRANDDDDFYVASGDPDVIELFKAHLNGFEFNLTSQLQKVPRTTRKRPSIKRLAENLHAYSILNTNLGDRWYTVTAPDSGYYIITKSGKPDGQTVIRNAYKLGICPTTVLHAIPISISKQFADDSKWINLVDEVERVFRTKYDNSIISRMREARREFPYGGMLIKNWPADSRLVSHPIIGEFIKIYPYQYMVSNVDEILNTAAHFKIGMEPTEGLSPIWNRIKQKYPLIRFLVDKKVDSPEIVDYINTIDAKKGMK